MSKSMTLADLYLASDNPGLDKGPMLEIKEKTPALYAKIKGAWSAEYNAMTQRVRSAHKIVLTDDFTRYAAKFSLLPPSYLLKSMSLARMPFDNCWIEFNERVRVETISSGLNRDPYMAERVGFLVAKGRDIYHTDVIGAADDHVAVEKLGFGFDFSRPITDNDHSICSATVNIGFDKNEPGLSAEQIKEAARRVEVAPLGIGYSLSQDDGEYETECIDQLLQHVRWEPGGTLKQITGILIEAWGEDFVMKNFRDGMSAIHGDFRFLLAITSLLNLTPESDIRIEKVKPERKFWLGGRFRPAYEHRVVSIQRPLVEAYDRVRKSVERMGSPRRWHTVMGAWHHSRTKGSPLCAHEWTKMVGDDGEAVGSDRHICRTCGKTKWFVKAHARGDRKLGVIEKSYEVTGRRPGELRRTKTVHSVDTTKPL